MNLEHLNLHLPIIAPLLRLLVDGLILTFSLIKWRKHNSLLEKTFISSQIPLDGYRKMILNNNSLSENITSGSAISIISFQPCNISFLSIRLLLTDTGHQFGTGAYIDLQGEGDFHEIHLYLPMIVSLTSEHCNNLELSTNSDKTAIIIKDNRSSNQRTGSFKFGIYSTVVMQLNQSGTSVTISLPISKYSSMTGQPMTKPLSIKYPVKGSNDVINLYYPKVDNMEIIISNPPKAFTFDPLGQTPVPEFYSDKECRWITGTNSGVRGHSSVTSRLQHSLAEERFQISRLRDGIAIGIWTAVLVTVSIDCLWSVVDLIRLLIK